MKLKRADVLFLLAVVVWTAAFYAASIDWGLPSRRSDHILFRETLPWDGKTLAAFDAPARAGAADVDVDPLDRSRGTVLLNNTDARTAEILRRFRLYSHQPDEMITLMALARMKPRAGDLDPKLYQYGGLWIYPVGGLIKLGASLGLVTLTADKAYYYDHPEAFGRLYVVPRAYTLAWVLVGVMVSYALGRRLTKSNVAGLSLAALFGCLPVVFSTGHEAKPHVPGAVLTLAAVWAGSSYVVNGRSRAALLTGGLCGAAAGMVISGVMAFAILPAMVLLRRTGWTTRAGVLALSTVAGVFVYGMTNPYVVVGLLRDPAALRANFGNSTAMYAPAGRWDGIKNAADLLVEAASPTVATMGGIALVGALLIYPTTVQARHSRVVTLALPPARAVGWLLSAATLPVLIQFVLLAADKPGEYGRFAITPAFALAAAAVTIGNRTRRTTLRAIFLVGLPLLTAALHTRLYARAFLADTRADGNDTRSRAAAYLDDLSASRVTLALDREPAPYGLPPVGLWKWVMLLPAPGDAAGADTIVRPVDRPNTLPVPPGYRRVIFDDGRPTRISWANKPIEVLVKQATSDR